jgi:hypothetical protein
VGDLHKKNCSLLIRAAQREDEARYFFRVEKGTIMKYNFKDKFWLKVTGMGCGRNIYPSGWGGTPGAEQGGLS